MNYFSARKIDDFMTNHLHCKIEYRLSDFDFENRDNLDGVYSFDGMPKGYKRVYSEAIKTASYTYYDILDFFYEEALSSEEIEKLSKILKEKDIKKLFDWLLEHD